MLFVPWLINRAEKDLGEGDDEMAQKRDAAGGKGGQGGQFKVQQTTKVTGKVKGNNVQGSVGQGGGAGGSQCKGARGKRAAAG